MKVKILYKTQEDKKILEKFLKVINNDLYDSKDENIKKFYENIELTDDKETCYKNENIIYFLDFYDFPNKSDKNEICKRLLELIDLYTFFYTNKRDDDFDDSYFNTNLYFFYDYMGEIEARKILKLPFDMPKDKSNLFEIGLLTFSNDKDINKNNDLINGYYYNREIIISKFEDIIGKGSFMELNHLLFHLIYNYDEKKIYPSYELYNTLSMLKEYFYKSLELNQNIKDDDKEIMRERFNKLYSELSEGHSFKHYEKR